MMTLRIRCLWKSGLKLLGPKVLSAALFLLFAASVPAGDVDVDLTVTNDGTTNIFVTLYDMSANPPYVTVMHHERINGFTSVPISVSADSNGRANVYWTATSVDSFGRKCGRGGTSDLNNHAAVKVQANSSCSD
jgi:hypothetical protein